MRVCVCVCVCSIITRVTMSSALFNNLHNLSVSVEKHRWRSYDKQERRYDFLLRQLDPLISRWQGQYPNLRRYFPAEDIEGLLLESVKFCGARSNRLGDRFIEFVARTNYRDAGPDDRRRATALNRALGLDLDEACVTSLFEIYDRYDVNYEDALGNTHFHVACKYGRYNLVGTFLELGQDPDCPPLTGCANRVDPPLYWALRNAHANVVELLLRHGADPNRTNALGQTPLHYIALRTIGDELGREFLNVCDQLGLKLSIDTRDTYGETALNLALSLGRFTWVEILLRLGADPNLISPQQLTPLHVICASDECDELIQLFFRILEETEQRVLIDARDARGHTPLLLALHHKRMVAAELLLRHGADPRVTNSDGYTSLHILCRCCSDAELLQRFLWVCENVGQPVAVDARDALGKTPLHCALEARNEPLTAALLRRGADPNLPDADGSSPLHIICDDYSDDPQLLKLFFRVSEERNRRVNVDAYDQMGWTPLQMAVANLQPRLVDVLIGRGADMTNFVFPTLSYMFSRYESVGHELSGNFKFSLAAGLMSCVDRLERQEYELDPAEALTILRYLARFDVFNQARGLEAPHKRAWLDDRAFAAKAEAIATGGVSLLELLKSPVARANELLLQSHANYWKFARGHRLTELGEPGYARACDAHLAEILMRKFLRFWAVEFFMEMIEYRLPTKCCEMIVKESMSNRDLWQICSSYWPND